MCYCTDSKVLKILIHESLVYCNRNFQLWEIFCPNNFHETNIDSLLSALINAHNKKHDILDASKNNHFAVIKQFHDNGINVNVKNDNSKHLLHFAAERGYHELIQNVLELPNNTLNLNNILDNQCRNILHYAVFSDSVPLFKYLLEQVLDVNSRDRSKLSAFHYAIIFHKNKIAEFILISNPELNDYNAKLYTISFCNANIFTSLGCNIFTDDQKSLIIHYIIYINSFINSNFKFDMVDIYKEYNEKCVNFIKFLGTDTNFKNEKGLTPLMIAAFYENKDFMNLLLSNFNIEWKDRDEYTVLHIAAYTHNKDILELLLKYHNNINIQDANGNSLLHYALIEQRASNCFEFVDFLLTKNANPLLANNYNITPLHLAEKNETIVGLLKTRINNPQYENYQADGLTKTKDDIETFINEISEFSILDYDFLEFYWYNYLESCELPQTIITQLPWKKKYY